MRVNVFDRQSREITEKDLIRLKDLAERPSIRGRYVGLDFVPSTCFGTLSDIWRLCAGVRSFTRGPESLTRFVRSLGRKTISPVVPLAADIGMRNERGYSVVTLGEENVKEAKATVLLDETPFERDLVREFSGDVDLLYSVTSLLNLDDLEKLEPS